MQNETIPTHTNEQQHAGSTESVVRNSDLAKLLLDQGIESLKSLPTHVIPELLTGKNLLIFGKESCGKSTASMIGVAARKFAGGPPLRAIFSYSNDKDAAQCVKFLSGLGLEVSSLPDDANAESDITIGSHAVLSAAAAESTLGEIDILVIDSLDADGLMPDSNAETLLANVLERCPQCQIILIGRKKTAGISGILNRYFSEGNVTEIGDANDMTVEAEHLYYELETDVMAKPNALCNILRVEGVPPTAVFCNEPSDADLVEVLLQKQGISARKLIGNVPPRVAASAFQDCLDGKVNVLVLTDISSRGIEVEDLELVVNYSIHNDPEVYLHRIGTGKGKLRKIISLVSPIDFGNFHYLKKIVDIDLVKAELPSDDELSAVRLKIIKQKAAQDEAASRFTELAKEVLEDDDRESIVSHLLHCTMELLPNALSEQGNSRRRSNRDSRDERGDRDDSRRGRRGRRDDDHGGRDSRRDRSENDGRDRDSRRSSDKPDRRPSAPMRKDARLYIGHGLNDKFSEESMKNILASHCDNTDETIQRLSIRNSYAFLDVREEVADELLEALSDTELEDGVPLFIKKATLIPVPDEEAIAAAAAEKAAEEEQGAEGDSDELEDADGPAEEQAPDSASS